MKADPTDDPLDTPLPCDVICGHVRFHKGVKLRTLANAAARWLKMAQDKTPPLTPAEKAAFLEIWHPMIADRDDA